MKTIIAILFFFAMATNAFLQDKKIEISKSVITNFQQNEFLRITENFDSTMKAALPAEKLKQVWEQLNTQCGQFQKFTDITTGKIQNYDVTYTLCSFAFVTLKMKLVFTDKNLITGLFFIPENQK